MDIDSILSNLTENDMEQLRQTAKAFFEKDTDGEPNGCASDTAMPDFSSLLGNAELISKISSVLAAMNKRDARSDLINALKPLLSEKRRKRADEAAQMIKLLELLPLLQGEGK